MTPPKLFVRVEWEAARTFYEPNDRRARDRTFTSLDEAARQVRALMVWPTHIKITAVWRTTGWRDGNIEWTQIDLADLPDCRAEVNAYYAALEAGMLSHPDARVREAATAATRPPTQESHDAERQDD